MRKRLFLLLLVLFSTVPVAAQQTPDYSIRNIRAAGDGDIIVQFEVVNNGAPATETTTAELTIATTGEAVASLEVPPLNQNEQITLTAAISATAPGLNPGSRVLFLIRVGIGDIEAENSNTVGDNSAITPAITVPITDEAQPTPEAMDESSEDTAGPPLPFTLPFNIDLSNPLHIALLIAAAGILLILIWMLTVILRLLFTRPPIFTTWQPPYVFMPLLNPESTTGRRQLWQQHAQSDALPLPCSSGSFLARKVLIGMNGQKLNGWHVSALRISQYDMYGRVARSQTIAAKGVVNRLDRALRKSGKLTPARLESMVRPAARRLLKDFRKRTKRTQSLPIALDIRFRGMHGEVRIVFELYQCVDSQWQMVDQWEPEMTVLSGSITENFTYSLYGQRPGETPRQFQQRLQSDLTQMLTTMIQQPPPVLPPPDFISDTAKIQAIAGDTVGNSSPE